MTDEKKDDWFHWVVEVQTENGLFRHRIRTNTSDLMLAAGEAESIIELAEDAMGAKAISLTVMPRMEAP